MAKYEPWPMITYDCKCASEDSHKKTRILPQLHRIFKQTNLKSLWQVEKWGCLAGMQCAISASHPPLERNPIMSRSLFFACYLVHRWKMDSWVIETWLHFKRTLQESLNDSRHLTSSTNFALGSEAALATDEAMSTSGCSKFASTRAKWLPGSRLWC